jgi:hypothetical protein
VQWLTLATLMRTWVDDQLAKPIVLGKAQFEFQDMLVEMYASFPVAAVENGVARDDVQHVVAPGSMLFPGRA